MWRRALAILWRGSWQIVLLAGGLLFSLLLWLLRDALSDVIRGAVGVTPTSFVVALAMLTDVVLRNAWGILALTAAVVIGGTWVRGVVFGMPGAPEPGIVTRWRRARELRPLAQSERHVSNADIQDWLTLTVQGVKSPVLNGCYAELTHFVDVRGKLPPSDLPREHHRLPWTTLNAAGRVTEWTSSQDFRCVVLAFRPPEMPAKGEDGRFHIAGIGRVSNTGWTGPNETVPAISLPPGDYTGEMEFRRANGGALVAHLPIKIGFSGRGSGYWSEPRPPSAGTMGF